MKLTCAIIDDEPLAVELMKEYVRKTPFLELCGAFGCGTEAFGTLRDHPVELLFCDIQMPGLNGMELTRMLPAETRVIFTTAFDSYAVEGFRVRAIDYLLKPISYADFLAAAQKALEWFEIKRRAEAAGAGLHHRHTGLQRAALGGKGKHRLGQTVLGGTRRAAEIEIREDAGTQPVLRGIAVQPHDGAAVDVLIIAVQDGHSGAPHFP